MKIESRRHAAEPDRAKPDETSSFSVVFESLPTEIFVTSVVLPFQHGFCRVKPQNHGSHKIHVRLFPANLQNFPGRIDARRGRESQAPARRQFWVAGKSFLYDLRSSGPQTNILRSLVDICHPSRKSLRISIYRKSHISRIVDCMPLSDAN